MTEMTEEKQNTISMTREQLNELNSLLEKALATARSAHFATAPAFKLMSKKCGRAIVCKIAEDLATTRHAFLDISELLQDVKNNYINEKRNKTINESKSEGEYND